MWQIRAILYKCATTDRMDTWFFKIVVKCKDSRLTLNKLKIRLADTTHWFPDSNFRPNKIKYG